MLLEPQGVEVGGGYTLILSRAYVRARMYT